MGFCESPHVGIIHILALHWILSKLILTHLTKLILTCYISPSWS